MTLIVGMLLYSLITECIHRFGCPVDYTLKSGNGCDLMRSQTK